MAALGLEPGAARRGLLDDFNTQLLPFWMGEGVRMPSGLAVEACSAAGHPWENAPVRLRVQTRQIGVAAQALLAGHPATSIHHLNRMVAALVGSFKMAPGRYARSVKQDGGWLDESFSLYDHGFVMYALAWAAPVLGDALLDEAEAVWRLLETHFAHPGGGFCEEGEPAKLRQQNPHMHLVEACLQAAAADKSGAEAWPARARRLIGFVVDRFGRGDGSLAEYTGDGAPRRLTHIREPGHHWEWIWLIGQAQRLGLAAPPGFCEGLAGFARRFGFDEATGLVLDTVLPSGARLSTTARLWPQCEALRCLTHTDPARADALAARIRTRFLRPAPRGCWLDRVAVDGPPLTSDRIPASTLYHLAGAVHAVGDSLQSKASPPS